MITEQQLAALPQPVQKLFRQLEADIIKKIAGRIGDIGAVKAGDITRLNELADIGYDLREIEAEIAKTVDKTAAQVYNILYDAMESEYGEYAARYGDAVTPFRENKRMQDMIESIAQATRNEFKNISGTAGFVNARNSAGVLIKGGRFQPLSEYYQSVIDYAALQVRTGQEDFYGAMRASLLKMADKGLSHVEYASGYARRMDSSIRAALMGARAELSKAQARLVGEEIGADGMEISLHSAPRPSHQPMGGQQYSMQEYYAYAEPLLGEYNCYHWAFPIILGVSTPAHTQQEIEAFNARDNETRMWRGKEYTAYGANQAMRRYETAIRKLKDRALTFDAAGDTGALQSTRARINARSSEYRAFAKAMGVPIDPQRASVSGYRGGGANHITARPGTRSAFYAKPYSVIDIPGRKTGDVLTRDYYDSSGLLEKQINTWDHGNPKVHPFGANGEHAHDVKIIEGEMHRDEGRELTGTERNDNGDIL